jgi:hypothetical protein
MNHDTILVERHYIPRHIYNQMYNPMYNPMYNIPNNNLSYIQPSQQPSTTPNLFIDPLTGVFYQFPLNPEIVPPTHVPSQVNPNPITVPIVHPTPPEPVTPSTTQPTPPPSTTQPTIPATRSNTVINEMLRNLFNINQPSARQPTIPIRNANPNISIIRGNTGNNDNALNILQQTHPELRNLISNLIGTNIPFEMQITTTNTEDSDNETLSLETINTNSTVSLYNSITNQNTVDQTCSICQNDFENNDILRKLNGCGHGFHLNCIDQWLQNHVTCPSCRHNILSSTTTSSTPSTNSRNVRNEVSSSSEYSDSDDDECECSCNCDSDDHECTDEDDEDNENTTIPKSTPIPPVSETIQQAQAQTEPPIPTQMPIPMPIPEVEQSSEPLVDMPRFVSNILTRGFGITSNTTASIDNVWNNLIVTGTPIIREIITNGTSNTAVNATVNEIMHTISPFANIFNDIINDTSRNNRR